MNEFLPMVRCEPELKQALEKIAAQSVSPRLSDHIRMAVEQYVQRELSSVEERARESANAATN